MRTHGVLWMTSHLARSGGESGGGSDCCLMSSPYSFDLSHPPCSWPWLLHLDLVGPESVSSKRSVRSDHQPVRRFGLARPATSKREIDKDAATFPAHGLGACKAGGGGLVCYIACSVPWPGIAVRVITR